MPLQHTKAMAQRQWQMCVTNSLTTSQHIPTQAFGTRRATWYYQYTWMHHTFPNPAVKVEKPVISTFPIAMTNNMDHLINALNEHYTVAIDMTGPLFCGIHLLNCHIPGYINKALTKYQHPKPVSSQHAPYKAAPIQYGARVQRVEVNTTQPLSPKEIKCVQDIIGTLLYYAQAVDPTLLAALSAIAAHQSNGTKAVVDVCHQLLDYVATHSNSGIWYKACNMVLSVHTDASYLSKPGGKS